MYGEVYIVTNTLTGDTYVGASTRGGLRRWRQHVQWAHRGSHLPLHKAIVEFGEPSFVLEIVVSALTKEGLVKLEKAVIKDRKPTYNLRNGGEVTAGRSSGRAWTDEQRAKLSATVMGRVYGPEVIERARQAKKKTVVCVNTGEHYETAKAAAEALGIGHRSVMRVLKGVYPSVKGLAFRYGS